MYKNRCFGFFFNLEKHFRLHLITVSIKMKQKSLNFSNYLNNILEFKTESMFSWISNKRFCQIITKPIVFHFDILIFDKFFVLNNITLL